MDSYQSGAGDRYQVDTPERVDLEYDVASLGSRFLATMVDTVLLTVINALLIILWVAGAGPMASFTESAARAVGAVPGPETLVYLALALGALLIFAIVWGYYLLFELFWHGQTPGKRWVGLRVIREGGYPVGFSECAIRNLVRIIDYLPAFYVIGCMVMFIDRRSRRLGDMAAGTLVVKERRDLRLDSLGYGSRAQPISPAAAALEGLGGEASVPNVHLLTAADQTLLREYLLRRPSLSETSATRLAAQLASAFAQKLEYDPSNESAEQFLLRLARQLGLR